MYMHMVFQSRHKLEEGILRVMLWNDRYFGPSYIPDVYERLQSVLVFNPTTSPLINTVPSLLVSPKDKTEKEQERPLGQRKTPANKFYLFCDIHN